MKIIVAADKNWAIGREGELLFPYSGRFEIFQKRRPREKTVVMGREDS